MLVLALEARHLLPEPATLTFTGTSHCLGMCAGVPFDLQWHWANDELHVWFKYATNSLLFRSHREGESPAPSLSLSQLLKDTEHDHTWLEQTRSYLTFEDLPVAQARLQTCTHYDPVTHHVLSKSGHGTHHLNLIFPVNP